MTPHRSSPPASTAMTTRSQHSSKGLLPPSAIALTIALLGACSSADSGKEKPQKDPAIEARAKEEEARRKEQLARDSDFDLVLLRIDKALAEYATNVAKSENIKATRRADSLRQYLEVQTKRFSKDLLRALGSDALRQRSISAAALGFTGDDEMVEPLVNALDDPEAMVRSNAALGLGQIQSPSTPLTRLAQMALDEKATIEERRAAAWTIYQIQVAVRPKGFVPLKEAPFSTLWARLLEGDTLEKDGILTVQSLRGLGMLRDPSILDSAARYLSHPKALVRQAALVAVARSRNRRGAPLVLPLLSTNETNPNVRLTARKALKALTGDRVDHEYDLKAWRNEFRDVIAEAGTEKR